MRLAIIIAAAALAVSACGESGSRQPQETQSITVRSAQQEELHKLNDLNRAIALKRAIYDSGFTCQRITESGFVGTYKNLDMWMARCADRRDWAIFTGPDGTAQVRYCQDVARMGLPECRMQASQQPDEAG